ncbi:DUF1643 domain-containing protein [Priestia flexa]|uniref:DUF1643 domain-containing protein n=1 Tax=Priestia flexa TaxID=86664 RepID=UPI001CD447AF|nr:DUF1643 domain-containing protein [Priestia flexa]MCA1202173.1 DUF1643 domain-containing protein [Priestia flexa]
MKREAIFDEEGTYQYSFKVAWSEKNDRTVTFILSSPMNTGTQQSEEELKKCMQLAQRWGFGSLEIVYLFSYQAEDETLLAKLSKQEAVGIGTNQYLTQAVNRAHLVIAAWGDKGEIHNRQGDICTSGKTPMYCFGMTDNGCPIAVEDASEGFELQRWSFSDNEKETKEVYSYIEEVNNQFFEPTFTEIKSFVQEEDPAAVIEEIIDIFR